MDTSSSIPLGRYLLGEKLATGGMGEVFVAVKRGRKGVEKPLAMKLLLPHLVEEAPVVKMFLAEAQLCEGMNHPNIVQILDVGREDGRYFLAMELVHGVSLVDLVRVLAQKQKTLSAPMILHVARALLDALDYAHTLTGEDGKPLGLIHRDVTPHNILVSDSGEVKLTDFGIAKVQAVVGQTRPGVVRGKMDYLSPEQLRFEKLDSRVDLFAAGLTLFFLATGRSAFFRTSTTETLKALQNDPMPFLDTLRPDLPRALVEAIARATQKDPNLRFASARAFREALPPPSADERAEVLGALVREVCPGVVKTLERATRTLLELSGGASASKPGRSSRPTQTVEPQGTASTKALALKGTVTAPVMLEQELPRPDVSDYVPPRVALRHDSTLMLAAPVPWSRKRKVMLVVAVLAGVVALAALGLGIGWWVKRSGAVPSPVTAPGDTKEPATKAEAPKESPTAPAPAAPTPAVVTPPDNAAGKEPGKGALSADAGVDPTLAKDAPASSPSTEPAGASPASEPQAIPTGPTGFLTVKAVPGTQVTVGGKPVGEAPLARLRVPAGKLEVELRNPKTGKTVRRSVRVRAGKESFIKVGTR